MKMKHALTITSILSGAVLMTGCATTGLSTRDELLKRLAGDVLERLRDR